MHHGVEQQNCMTNRMKLVSEKHIFALYYDNCSTVISNTATPFQHTITDDNVLHRIKHVLRLEIGDELILFDYMCHMRAVIVQSDKKKSVVECLSKTVNNILKPTITVLLPVLKRDSLEASLYNLTQMGVTTVQLIITDKVQRKWQGAGEKERLEKVVQSAAEQAKQFAGLRLLDPIPLKQSLELYCTHNARLMYMDPSGQSMLGVFEGEIADSYVVMVGPEGDLTQQEKDAVQHAGFSFYRLTPTILKAVDAVSLVAGIIRSLS